MTDNNGVVQSGEIITADNLPEPVYNEQGKMVDAWFIDGSGIAQHVVAGPNQHVTKNGALYDHSIGRFVTQGITGRITRDNAAAYQAKRIEVKQAAARQAIIDASESDQRSLKSGLKTIFAAQVDLALEKGAYSTRAAEFLVKQAGLDAAQGDNVAGLTVHLDAETARALLSELRARRKQPDDDDV